jgi:hypothetical protein
MSEGDVISECIRRLRRERITPHLRADDRGPDDITLMDALYPPAGGPSLLDERQLLYVIVQVVYTLECLVRVGIMHLNARLDRIVLVREEKDPGRARSYHFVDRSGVARTLHVPFYGWVPMLVGFVDSVKHGFDALAIAGAIVPIDPGFRGGSGKPGRMRPSRRFLLRWFDDNMDAYVDSHKFLLELLTARKNGEEWDSAPSGRPFGKGLLGLLSTWTRKDYFRRERFTLRSVVNAGRLLVAAKSVGARAPEQADAVYPTVFPDNLPFRVLEELDAGEAARGALVPRCEHMDLREEGASDNCTILAACADGGALARREGAEVVERYDMSRLHAKQ